MNILSIIDKKRRGLSLKKEQIKFFVDGYVDGSIPDYQMSALLMAITINGMNKQETFDLTEAMFLSGAQIDLSNIDGPKYDKHSTGGVGDKTSLVLLPLVASCGIKFCKLSGRGLGHTGGTLDKLESIPGFNTSLNEDSILEQVRSIGICIAGQTKDIVPADKKMYALRDVTDTVKSIPLIASSVMSKKIAAGADSILLNVTCGNGAFMSDLESATELSKLMVEIGNNFGRKTSVIISTMDEPLGFAIGNNLEIKEVVDSLKGNGPTDLMELVFAAGSLMLINSNLAKDKEDALAQLNENISNGKGYEKFKEMVKAQGGDTSYLDDLSKFKPCKYSHEIKAINDGYIHSIDTKNMGIISSGLGAGRIKVDDVIDFSAGVMMYKKIGDFVKKGDILCTAYTERTDVDHFLKKMPTLFTIKEEKCEKLSTISEIIE